MKDALDGEKFGRTKIILKGIHFYETLKEHSGVVSEPMTELIVSFIPFKYMATIYIIISNSLITIFFLTRVYRFDLKILIFNF